ncbi:hypothetical protein F0L68_39715 [Solihabitans fulvus]|uniref:Uncharacterized protein n=1 Tax=Solihabitans fulvus TaxID=1892852 RepID=A0A5B2WD82_9PSEU|nr:hypothetical protein [Solihabitans fulvus]KAA2248680.1 hypothetical protein F0L68_39715 [Solihabitans fulvus]
MLTDLAVTPDNTNRVLNELNALLRERELRLAVEHLTRWPDAATELAIATPAGVFTDRGGAANWSYALKIGRKLGLRAVVPHPITLADVHGDHQLRDLLQAGRG